MPYATVLLFLLIVIALALVLTKGKVLCRITILDYERGLRYARGKFTGVMGPGQYWYLPFFVMIRKVDVRPRFVSITGQEVLSADGVTLKVSLAANYEIVAPHTAINSAQDFQEALYLELQLALRELIGGVAIDSVLNGRDELSKRLAEKTAPKAQELGLRLISVNLKDIMFPGKLKEMFAQVVNARKEGLAALERARGETAALRSLANAAKMIEANPNLIQLRLVQALSQSSGSTLVLGMPPQSVPLPVKAKDLTPGRELPGPVVSTPEPREPDS